MRLRDVLLAAVLVGAACGDDDGGTVEVPCRPSQPAPYPQGIPYVGIHANPGSSDFVDCDSASAFEQVWHSLVGLAVVQPNTFSPDGNTVYVTTANPDPDGCRVHALSARDGTTEWCRTFHPTVVGSAVEVDADGFLYLAVLDQIVSLNADGSDRWATPIGTADPEGGLSGPLGLHFTPGGHVATVTNGGVVYLLARDDGRVLASYDIPAETGFVPPRALMLDLDIRMVAPDAVVADLDAIFGAGGGGGFLGAFLGAGGGFSDNTIGVSPRDELFVVGGGADPDHGAMIQLRIAPGPTIERGWHVPLVGGSATSPSVTRDGRYVNVGDGSTPGAILDPGSVRATVKGIDVDACDDNTDDDDHPQVCAPIYEMEMERGPMAGAPALDDQGVTYLWETTLRLTAFGPEAVDLRAAGPSGTLWEVALPDDLTWSAVMTVTRNHIVGTVTRTTVSDERILDIRFPGVAESFLAVVDRATGQLVFRAPVPDDSSATVTIGPDGSLYVGMLGLLSIMAVDTTPTLGIVRFAPTR
ncbi:MAG: PQQ-binding-like beta-propeller repeat protein [Deltaproteobacteria bacterium]|nr:PQQ-binding-like beta-propeller repeat protein [Deltaproteobacteria bacterium]